MVLALLVTDHKIHTVSSGPEAHPAQSELFWTWP